MDGWWGSLGLLGNRITMIFLFLNEGKLLGWWRRILCLWFHSVECTLGSWLMFDAWGFHALHMPASKQLAWCPPRPSMLLLSSHCWQSMDHRWRETPRKKGGRKRCQSSSKQWIYRAKTCWFNYLWRHTTIHTPDRTTFKHTCAHFHWNFALAIGLPSISFFPPSLSRLNSLLLWHLTHSCWGERGRWKAEVIRKALSVILWRSEALSFSPLSSLHPFVLSLFSQASPSPVNSEENASCSCVSCLLRRQERHS